MKKTMTALTALLLTLALLLTACGKPQPAVPAETGETSAAPGTAAPEKPLLRVMSLKGPTSMGLVKLSEDNEKNAAENRYELTVVTAADEITAALVAGKTDIAFLPANAAAALYNKAGGFKIAAVNNLGVLHVVENGDGVKSLEDLKGRTLYLTGKGTTPEYALRFLLTKAGLEDAVKLEFKSEAAEVVAALASDTAALGLLPEPFVTTALMQNEKLRRALDLNEVWAKLAGDSALVTGVCVIRNEVLTAQPAAAEVFLKEFAASLRYSNEEPAAAAEGIVRLGIVAKAPIAEKALPGCSLKYVDGTEMKTLVAGYLQTLFDQNPAAIGGKLPDDGFWYVHE